MFDLGVLIIGDSGVGKSETALELISRGHRFISDDVTVVSLDSRGFIIGCAPELSCDFMEIRGLGIINIKEIFGADSIQQSSTIDLVVKLRKWEEGKEYDRLGIKFYGIHNILGQEVPLLNIPVAPGRNMATLVEVACKVHVCKGQGYHAPDDIINKLDRVLMAGAKKQGKHQ